MRRSASIGLLTLLVLTAGCSASEPTAKPAPDKTTAKPASKKTTAAPTTASSPAAIVGRWEQVHTCRQLVTALNQAGLQPVAPAVAGDYFPGTSPQQLAKKAILCKGATPQRHSHFFTEDGQFGSLDQGGNQVDDGTYQVLNDHVLRIGPDAQFRYRISGGKTLRLHPLIRAADRRKALAHPLEFSKAGWQVAVSYDGLEWRRVPCQGWC